MNHSIQTEFLSISPGKLQTTDGKFCFRYSVEDKKLIESVTQWGVLSPISVRDRENKLEVIAGFKRLYAALTCGIESVPIQKFSANLSEKEWIALALELGKTDERTLLDCAEALRRWEVHFGIPEKEIADYFLPRLGFEANSKTISELRSFATLNRNILEALHRGALPYRGIVPWVKFSGEDQQFLWDAILRRFYFTSSELAECAVLIHEIVSMRGISVRKFLEMDLIEKTLSQKTGSEKVKAEPLMHRLKQIRYPESYEYKKAFKDHVARLRFSESIQIYKSDSMEEEGIELRIRIPKKESLAKALGELEEKRGQVEKLVQ
ncbi:MAG: ParB N-terminal domain-containing protein [Candidatus Omnitrophica bacterium]|nr:ParB N-terminal domain-containing protein [Candidatus Omnitrophota bacterium]